MAITKEPADAGTGQRLLDDISSEINQVGDEKSLQEILNAIDKGEQTYRKQSARLNGNSAVKETDEKISENFDSKNLAPPDGFTR